MSKERIKALQLEIEKEREHIDSLTNNLQEKNEQLISKEKELEELMSVGRFQPKYNEYYWNVQGRGELGQICWDGGGFDKEHYNFGNCFPTEEAAIKRRDFMQFLTDNNLWDKVEQRVRLQVELEAFAKEVNSGWIADWTDTFENKYSISLNRGKLQSVSMACISAPNQVFFKDYKCSNSAIGKFSNRLQILFEPLT